MGCVNFWDKKYTKILRAQFRQGLRDGHERTNHVHGTMYILDVISSVSRSSKCTKIVGSWGHALDHTGGAYNAPQIPNCV